MGVKSTLFLTVLAVQFAGIFANDGCPAPPGNSCPTVTSTGKVCDCTVPLCAYMSTISNPAGCPTPVATVTQDYGCDGAAACPTGCATYYTTATTLVTTTPAVTALPDSCTARPTQTFYSAEGCDLPCNTDIFCVSDAPVTQSCGCPSVAIEPQTTTVCPTATGCVQCTTAWGTFIVTETCVPTPL